MWVDEFYQLLRSNRAADAKAAQELKAAHLPTSLFKYRNPDDLRPVESDRLWMARADTFNDPYDSSLYLDVTEEAARGVAPLLVEDAKASLTPEEQREVLGAVDPVAAITNMLLKKEGNDLTVEEATKLVAVAKEHAQQTSREMSEHISARWKSVIRVSCLSAEGGSLVMWAHYTDNHRGYCIEYAVPDLDAEHLERLYPVRYCETRFDGSAALSRYLRENVVDPSDALLPIIAAGHKSSDWEYEREWRFIHASDGGVSVLMPKPAALYLGARMPVDQRTKILGIAASKGIPCYEMRLAHSTFSLERHPIPTF